MSTQALALTTEPSLVPTRSQCFQLFIMMVLAGGLTYWGVVFAESGYKLQFAFGGSPAVPSVTSKAPKLKIQDRILPEESSKPYRPRRWR